MNAENQSNVITCGIFYTIYGIDYMFCHLTTTS